MKNLLTKIKRKKNKLLRKGTIGILSLLMLGMLGGCNGKLTQTMGVEETDVSYEAAQDTEAAERSEATKASDAAGVSVSQTPDAAKASDASQTSDATNTSDASDASNTEPDTSQELPDTSYDFTICFAGDINFDDTWCTMGHLRRQENGILDCISPELVKIMQAADYMCLNNEFTYSTGGAPLEGKAYCFQSKPENVELLHTLGVDGVSLANNHVYDYGSDSLVQTLETLENAEIDYTGAGRNLADARKPIYIELDGKVVSIVAGSRAEKNKKTPQATDTEPGILRCYDTTLLKETIAEAKENSDFCILFIHWGTEYSTKLEKAQTESSREYLEAGADVIIGAHSHCLQGMEFYDGKPIIYSLGNYWFNEKTMDTMLIQLHFSGDGDKEQLTVQVIPAQQTGYETHYVSEPEAQRALYDRLEEISVNVQITDEGIVSAFEIE